MRYLVILVLGAVLGAVVMFHAFPALRPLPPMPLQPEVITVDTADAGAYTSDAPPPQEPVPPAPPVTNGDRTHSMATSADLAENEIAPSEPSGSPAGGFEATGPGADTMARDVPPLREGYEPAQPGSIVPLEATPAPATDTTADAGEDALEPPPLTFAEDTAVGPPVALAPAPQPHVAPDATKAPIGPEPPAAEPKVKEPVAANEIAAATAVDDATDAPHEPEAEPKAVPTPVYLPQPGALLIPVNGIEATQLIDTFDEGRNGRSHEAIDILAPAGTPVVAVEDGKVAKLFDSERGGLTVYQFDPTEKFAYYYAHLQSYAPGIVEGKELKKGDLVGYVGATGNANPATPHLHFAVFVLGPEKRWWQGTAINPYPLLGGAKTLTAEQD